jgi:hypothetical protein
VNDIYAIDPRAPEDLKDLKLLSELFGFAHGRFVAEYPVDWIYFLQSRLKEMGALDQSRASILLNKFLKNTLPVEGGYLRSKDWLSNALELQNREHKFKNIITAGNESNLPSLSKILYEDELPDARGEHIKPELNSYRNVVNPLFLVSTEIHMQDMYFTLEEDGKKLFRQWDVLRMLVNQAKDSKRCNVLIFHLNQEKFPTPQIETRLEESFVQVLEELGADDLEVGYSLENKKVTHGRYIFSIKGGLQFDHGFDTDLRTQDKRNHVHWLSHNELHPLLDRYNI